MSIKEEKRQKIIESLKNCVTSDDVIAAIISFFPDEEFPLDTVKIHSAVYELKTRFPELLAEFSFTSDDAYPYSRLLEKVLFRLISAGLITYYLGPEMAIGIISSKSKQYIKENILPLFNRETQEKLAQMGKLFRELILQRSSLN